MIKKQKGKVSRTITISLDTLSELCHYESLPLKNRVSEKLLPMGRKITIYRKSLERLLETFRENFKILSVF